MSIASCSDSSYDDKYADPSKTSEVGVPYMFTSVMYKGRQWMDFIYYRYYTQNRTSGIFSGIIGDSNERGRFRGASEGYYNTRWQNFYDMVTQYRLLEHTYNNLSEGEKTANLIFYHLARTMVDAQLHEVLSLWGDVPFKGAGTLWMDNDYDRAKNQCTYDDDVELYRQILNDLKETNDYLATSPDLNSTVIGSLERQDYSMAAGDITIWRKYVNSLRLRIALHLSTNGDLTSEAHAAIAEMLNNPGQYPMIDSNAENMGVTADTQSDDFNYGKNMAQAHYNTYYANVSQSVLDAMRVPANGIPDENTDPRLQAMYDPNPDGEYISFDITKNNSEISNLEDQKHQEYIARGILTSNYYCKLDSQALVGWDEYEGNINLNSLWIGAAEVSLSKAEAYLMGYGVAASESAARENFIKGVEQSAEYYWDVKKGSSLYRAGNDSYNGFRTLTEPSDADITAYAESIWEPTQEAICTQLWLNFNYTNELEAWNVTRRTAYPLIPFSRDIQVSNYATPPHRLPYVSDELNYNNANCQAAISSNYEESTGYYTPLFWAKRDYYHMID